MVYAVGYDEENKVLEVVFRKGSIWQYRGVPKRVYEELIHSGSIGSYMRNEVLDCYEARQV